MPVMNDEHGGDISITLHFKYLERTLSKIINELDEISKKIDALNNKITSISNCINTPRTNTRLMHEGPNDLG